MHEDKEAWYSFVNGLVQPQNFHLCALLGLAIELVSKELNHFEVNAGLFWQNGGHSSSVILLFLKTFHNYLPYFSL